MTSMIEKITLRTFLFCLVTCASLVLFIIWSGGPDTPDAEVPFKIAATLFILGLGSFLTWFSTMLYSLRDVLRKLRSAP